jgi:membrane-associated protease RseP (regulator of RpoE activity)
MSSEVEPKINFLYSMQNKAKKDRYYINIILFVATFISCLIAGTQWAQKDFTEVSNWHFGITYAILIMTFLTAHEMGHYIASRIHKVNATLPFFIPMPIPGFMLFGTMGAMIKTTSPFPSRKSLFDIGAAGPIAGFIVCVIILIIGYTNLPTIDFIYKIHPEYLNKGGIIPTTGLYFGDNLLLNFFRNYLANPSGWLPPMNEIYHYPFLCVGWFGLFVTTMNMLPLGQLDGGHILYSLIGVNQKKVAMIVWYIMLFIGVGALLGFAEDFLSKVDYPYRIYILLQNLLLPVLKQIKALAPWYLQGWGGWLFWALITRFFIHLPHPEFYFDDELDTKRKIIGWLTFVIFIISFSISGIYIIE